jgi:lipopolysaccharide export system ATP-binding protein
MTQRKLRTEKLVKTYDKRTVVKEVSIEITKGEIVGLLGPNGAGKSTTFNMVVGLVKPTSGQIMLDDQRLAGKPIHERARLGIGYLAQDKSIFQNLTVEENLMAILETRPGLSKAARRERLDQLLEELGVTHVRKQGARTLSGGERRRVEIARALVCEPDFMLLDEPFSGVDPKAVEEIQEIIYQLQKKGLGVLITDHSVRETLTVTDRAYIIHEGKVMISGTASEIVNNPEAKRLYLGERFYMDTSPDERKSG